MTAPPAAGGASSARQVALGLAHLHRVRQLRRGAPEAKVEERVGELGHARPELVVAHVPEFLRLHRRQAAAVCRSRTAVAIDSLAAASRSAACAWPPSTPSISKSMRPGLTTATQISGEPFPFPMRVSAGFLVSGLSGKTRTHTRPPRLMLRVRATRS